CSSYIDINVLF
nr:immunoglobulin light chain junction region [Macaca mulatta]MPO05736.1 immunoglobulin light chain junction region [Macaca mulatta]MPO06118.1 immunoglobulin light chain junction region [Macaca mulatta]MPO08446.1 immunoglobulin light chain junction region [Macaca mulatta]MPO08833.1 immunoglobulin light chain junction region [Macaca mulatta]